MKQTRILFVDDDKAARQIALFNLREAGCSVEEASSAEQALSLFTAALEADKFDLVVTDVRMPGLSGIDLLKEIRRLAETPVIVVTAYGTIEMAVNAMRLGAHDFVLKPFNKDQLLHVIEKSLEYYRLKTENRELRIKAKGVERPIVHQSSTIADIMAMIDRVALSGATVLLTGESGTGKELFARRLHARSPRAEAPFIAINCGAIPAELLESELFGHVKGAFTGAVKERQGRFRQAGGGTIFLDEIGELPPNLQVKLLRVLQEQMVDVVGRDEPIKVDVRIVCATNQDLQSRIGQGAFREDLYYRLNVVSIHVPPLREHKEDIPFLMEHFFEVYSQGREYEVPAELMDVAAAYDWPGNVRELENVCKRLLILCEGRQLRLSDLPAEIRQIRPAESAAGTAAAAAFPIELPDSGLSLIDLEKSIIEKTLEKQKGNVSQAANYLRIPRHVLAYRMEKYGLTRKQR